jgi:hypothetical protein
MPEFDFIGSQEFKRELERDYDELVKCRQARAWKAVHVLAGSIVEAVLSDYVVTSGAGGCEDISDVTRMDLATLVQTCREAGVITERTAALSEVVRSYRNLIHPGRIIRTKETVDEQGAEVAHALVSMIVAEVDKSSMAHGRLTAGQLLSKVIGDASATSIIPELLAGISNGERERLVMSLIPDRYLAIMRAETRHDGALERLATLYRAAFDSATDESRQRATKRFVGVLRLEPEDVVLAHETAFFRGSDLQHLDGADATMVKKHLIARLKVDRTTALLEAAHGISPYLSKGEQADLVDAIVSEIVYGTSPELDEAARALLNDLYARETFEADAAMIARLKDWLELLRGTARMATEVRWIEALVASFSIGLETAEGGEGDEGEA